MTPLQRTLLDAAIPLSVFEGWTKLTLEKAAESAGLPAVDAVRAFPGGAIECLECFSADADARMLESLTNDYTLSTMKIRERIATAVMVRLNQNLPYRESIRRGLACLLQPWNASTSARALYRTVDAIWKAAGDTSTDYNFYTKRALLAKVYLSTLMVWLDDHSENQSDTFAFLNRRIEDVMQIQKIKSTCSKAMTEFKLPDIFTRFRA